MAQQAQIADPAGMASLDDPAVYDRLDPERLGDRIAGLPDQIEAAFAAGRSLELPDSHRSCERIAVLGMGGSGIGGALLQAFAADAGSAPVTLIRGYRLPAHVGERTLAIASSNSGETEEVVAAFDAAVAAGARCVAIAAGGRLLERARARGVPALVVDWPPPGSPAAEPRAALGWSFAALLAICANAGLLPDVAGQLPGAVAAMRAACDALAPDVDEDTNAAKQLARRLHGRLPVFLGAEAMAPVAYRWRTQVNENAESWAIADELPEFNHNAQAGFGLPRRIVPLLHVAILHHAAAHPRIAPRIEATRNELARAGVSSEVIAVEGSSILEQMLRAICLGDWTSYYLGILNGVSPSPVEGLDRIKATLRDGGA